ncbi:MAG: hypothetical protein IH588_11315 [Anaerolineales bacterium]|nr:hypothetical protein [Anaerolineales bacterium]
MLKFASSKLIERDAVEPSGFVAAPSHVPVNGSGGIEVEVDDKDVGEAGAGVAVGEAQADRTHSRRRDEMMRMSVNIIQRIRKIPIQLGGL